MVWIQNKLKVFLETWPGTPPTPTKTREPGTLFLSAVAIELVVGLQNKLAEVLVHVLGVKKNVSTVLGNSAGKASNFQP